MLKVMEIFVSIKQNSQGLQKVVFTYQGKVIDYDTFVFNEPDVIFNFDNSIRENVLILKNPVLNTILFLQTTPIGTQTWNIGNFCGDFVVCTKINSKINYMYDTAFSVHKETQFTQSNVIFPLKPPENVVKRKRRKKFK